MQIHELNNYSGSLGDAYLVADNGSDTGKMKTTALTDPLNERIDNIISGPAPSAAEIIDARRGANGTNYTSLGAAIRSQVSDLTNDLDQVATIETESNNYYNNLTATLNKSFDSTGEVIDSATRCLSDKIYMAGDISVTCYLSQSVRDVNGIIGCWKHDGTFERITLTYKNPAERIYQLPADTDYIRVTVDNQYINNTMVCHEIPSEYVPYDEPHTEVLLRDYVPLTDTMKNEVKEMIPTDIFEGKTILFTGDSICYGAGWRLDNENDYLAQHDDMINKIGGNTNLYLNSGWAQIIAENHPLASVYGYGLGGTRIQRDAARISSKGYDDSILERITVMKSEAEYVIFQGGINDCFSKLPLGNIVENNNNADYNPSSIVLDEYTFAGAMERLCINALSKWTDAKIGFILTPKNHTCEHQNYIVDGVDFRLSKYMDIAKKACEKWGIPTLDLFHECGFNTGIIGGNTEYFQDGDNTHPTEKTYRLFLADKIEAWLKTL